MEQTRIDNWQVSDNIRRIVRDKFAVVGGTKVVEDSFQRGRQEERAGGNANLEMRPARLFDKLLRSRLIPELHHYKEVLVNDVVLPRGLKDRRAPEYFRPAPKDSTRQLRDIMGKSATTPWHSPSPIHVAHQVLPPAWHDGLC